MRRAIRTLTITMPSPILENSPERRQNDQRESFCNMQMSEANPGTCTVAQTIALNDGPISALDNINSNATIIDSY